jgi:glycolate oxidase FAD binding subunit
VSGPGRPEWILGTWAPTDAGAIAKRLRETGEAPLLPTGGGTTLGRGGAPERPVLALETGALDRVVEHAAEDLTVTVEAGLRLESLEPVLAARNQWLPPGAGDPGTVGGLIAADRRNLWSGGYGSVRDYLLGVEFIDGRGGRIRAGGRVVKNVAGYDLMKLLTGSLGALGVVVEATFKVLPRPGTVRLLRHPHEPPGESGSRLVAVLDRVRPAALWRQREPGADHWYIALAGSATRVEAETAAVRDVWGPGTEDAGTGNGLPRVPDPDPEGLSVWGGALPAFLAGVDPEALGAGTPWTADLLGGHLWGRIPREAGVAALAALRRSLVPGEGHLHLDDGSGSGPAVWGRPSGDAGALLRGIKQALDPGGRLVSGRWPGET